MINFKTNLVIGVMVKLAAYYLACFLFIDLLFGKLKLEILEKMVLSYLALIWLAIILFFYLPLIGINLFISAKHTLLIVIVLILVASSTKLIFKKGRVRS